MRVISLGSGSSGNALLLEAGPKGRTKILVDAGFNSKTLIERLRSIGISPSQLQAILITHEHSDHILGLPSLAHRHAIPVITDPRTVAAIEQIVASGYIAVDADQSGSLEILSHGERPLTERIEDRGPQGSPLPNTNTSDQPEYGKGDPCGRPAPSATGLSAAPARPAPAPSANGLSTISQLSRPLPVGSRCMVGDIEVISFPVSHDAVAPCGYLLSTGGCRVCVAIDSGEVTLTMLEALSQADLLILESNHDREKLLRGPYPYSLKQRILSPTGHLSNDQAADAVLRTWRGDGVRWLWLSHLSRTNNTPKLALHSMRTRLTEAKANLAQAHISVLPPGMGPVWDSTQLWHSPSLWEMPG